MQAANSSPPPRWQRAARQRLAERECWLWALWRRRGRSVATEHMRPLGGGPFVFTTVSLGCNGAENPRVAPKSQLPPMFYSTVIEKASVTNFIGKSIPRPDRFLSRDRRGSTEIPARNARPRAAMIEPPMGEQQIVDAGHVKTKRLGVFFVQFAPNF